MAVPYTFGTATASIPLSQLDSNFATVITLGNTAIQLGNTVTTLNNMTLANVTISSGNVTLTNVTITTANVTTANVVTLIVTGNETVQGNTTVTGTITGAKFIPTGSSVTGNGLYLPAANSVGISTNGTNAVYIDSTQNVGLGVTPSAWNSTYKASQVGNATAVVGRTNNNNNYFSSNWFVNSSNQDIYQNTGFATIYSQGAGTHAWYNAASGTAGNTITFTQAMKLDASGNLGLGVTPSAWSAGKVIEVGFAGRSLWGFTQTSGYLTTNAYYNSGFKYGGTGTAAAYEQNGGSHVWYATATSGTAGGTITFTQPMTLDSSGNLLVGVTSNNAGVSRGYFVADSSNDGLWVANALAAATTLALWNKDTANNNIFATFSTESSKTTRGSITYNRAGGLTVYNTTSDYRAKDITGPVNGSGALIDSVPVYMGKMKWATEERPMFIAHETPVYAHTGEKDAVDADGNPVYQQMDASALIPVMWAELQSLRARVAQLESKL